LKGEGFTVYGLRNVKTYNLASRGVRRGRGEVRSLIPVAATIAPGRRSYINKDQWGQVYILYLRLRVGLIPCADT